MQCKLHVSASILWWNTYCFRNLWILQSIVDIHSAYSVHMVSSLSVSPWHLHNFSFHHQWSFFSQALRILVAVKKALLTLLIFHCLHVPLCTLPPILLLHLCQWFPQYCIAFALHMCKLIHTVSIGHGIRNNHIPEHYSQLTNAPSYILM